jgi:hypothetical protein
MANYQVYNVNYGGEQTISLTDMGIINVKGKIKYEQLELIIEEFIKNNFKEFYNELIDLVLINVKTKQILHRFNLVFELDELDNPIDQTLHPFLDVLESEFLYEFLEAYKNTYGKEFDGYYKEK